jgi:WhiB family redox-sensing transcriptional regulator
VDQAACVGLDPDMFFPDAHEQPLSPALGVCRECPVQQECLEHALLTDERYGIWGGWTEDERERLRRQESRARARRPAV